MISDVPPAGSNVTDINVARSMLSYALRYIARGFWVLPIEPGAKKPFSRLVPNGFLNATNDAEVARRWWTQYPNGDVGIGIAMRPSSLVTVDVDPRNGGLATMDDLEAIHGPLTSDMLAYTGGGGEHRVFASSLIEGLPGTLGPGVDLKADGFICVEPTIHPSGKRYVWEASSDPLEGAIASTLPGWVRDLARMPAARPVVGHATRYVDPKQVGELREALATIPADDYHQWITFGNALSELGQAGYTLWDQWSQRSKKYDPQAMTRKWRSFKPGKAQIESIFFTAQQLGWINPMSTPEMAPAVPLQQVRLAEPAPSFLAGPTELLRPPGMLGTVAEWVNATSRKPQPAFAVQTAIAFMATVMGRRFVTDEMNWPSLYLLNIGKSASGKEHGKWAVEKLLEGCELGHLIGPASYTSASGLLSALHGQPSHCTVIDEFGKTLENASVKNNARDRAMLAMLIEVWGRADGVLRPQGYSTFGMSAKDAAMFKERSVRNPALTLLAMTTPETFFDAIGSAAARDGFLNRFLIVESDVGRQTGHTAPTLPVPPEVIAWAQEAAASVGPLDPSSNPSLSPTATTIPISPNARTLLQAFDAECVRSMDGYEGCGLAEMFGRTNEMAMKLALVVAVGCASKSVEGLHVAWAINYVRHHAQRAANRLSTTVADSDFESLKKRLLAEILKSAELGMTVRELSKKISKFAGLDKRGQMNALESMRYLGEIDLVEIDLVKVRNASGRGIKREAWVAIDQSAINAAPADAAAID